MPLPTEQWFLDLDGVRSGPYKTPEVLSLVAEGEILPHHRISTGLKDQNWITILDWRLNQSRKDEAPPLETDIPHEENEISDFQEIKAELMEAVEEPKPSQPPFTLKLTTKDASPSVIDVSLTDKPANQPGRRDPTAEMFDLIQAKKAKREINSQKEAVESAEKDYVPASAQNAKNLKFVGFLVAVTLGGFFLGQMFQNSSKLSEPKPEVVAQAKPSVSPEPTVATEVIERKDEKLTIRAKVPTQKKEVAPLLDKETQEMKDLKRELQEMRALKEELKNPQLPENPVMDENAANSYQNDYQAPPANEQQNQPTYNSQ